LAPSGQRLHESNVGLPGIPIGSVSAESLSPRRVPATEKRRTLGVDFTASAIVSTAVRTSA
jgi:hypothetical protein